MLPLLLASLSLAAPPEGLLPLVDRPGLQISWSEQARAAGAEGEAAVLACRMFAEELALCFTAPQADGQGRRMVTLHDLSVWEVDLATVEAAALAGVAAGLSEDRPQGVQVEGDPRSYLLSAEGDGLDQAGLFDPVALQARMDGQAFAVGIPARGVLIAFPRGDRELETIVTVGVRRLWETVDEPITPKVYTWDGERWVIWGEATPGPRAEPSPDPLARPPG
jgi:hypothetical protein